MGKCSAPNCENKDYQGFVIVGFPRDEKLLEAWQRAAGMPTATPKNKLCEVHFRAETWAKQSRLKVGSIPTLFCNCSFKVMPKKRGSTKKIHKPECPVYWGTPSLVPKGQPLPMKNTSIFAEPITKKSKMEIFLTHQNKMLRSKLEKARKESRQLRSELERTKDRIEKQEKMWQERFGPDQIACIFNGRTRRWEAETVIKGLQMRFTEGKSALKTTETPMPGLRTLQRRIQKYRFDPGVLHESLKLFKQGLKEYDNLDCVLLWDEMWIKRGSRFWDAATQSHIGCITLPGKNEVARKILVFMFAGVKSDWKTVAAYHFIPDVVCTEEVKKLITELLGISRDMGLNVVGFVCDIDNGDLMQAVGFSTKEEGMKNWIVHPLDSEKVIYCFPDAVHKFKTNVFSNEKDVDLAEDIILKFNLSQKSVKFSHVRILKDLKETLDSKNTKPNRVKRFLVYKKGISDQCATTVWFIDLMNRWFKVVTAREFGLSKNNPEEYQQALDDLQLVVQLMSGMEFSGGWERVRKHVIISTVSMLAIQDDFLGKAGCDYVCLGRFQLDFMEKLFSLIRYKRPMPSAVEVKYRLKQIVLGKLL